MMTASSGSARQTIERSASEADVPANRFKAERIFALVAFSFSSGITST